MYAEIGEAITTGGREQDLIKEFGREREFLMSKKGFESLFDDFIEKEEFEI